MAWRQNSCQIHVRTFVNKPPGHYAIHDNRHRFVNAIKTTLSVQVVNFQNVRQLTLKASETLNYPSLFKHYFVFYMLASLILISIIIKYYKVTGQTRLPLVATCMKKPLRIIAKLSQVGLLVRYLFP